MGALRRVVVLGAGGEMGARVCRLMARVPEVELLGVSRSARGPAGVAMARGDLREPASVAALLRAGDLVVNCVGPFHYDADVLVGACIAARAHYCDLADDVAFVERARAAAARHGAEANGVLVCTGASTIPGITGVLAHAFERAPRAAEIARVSVYLSVGSRNPVSAGLLASVLAPLGRRMPDGARCFAGLRALRSSDGRLLRFGAYPAAFPRGELAIGARAAPARFWFGFDRAALSALLRLAAPALAQLPREAIAPLARALLPLARAAPLFGTPRGLLALVAEDAAGRELARIELSANERGLDVPAAPPIWLATRLARAPAPSGARELSELVPLEDVISWAQAEPQLRLHLPGGADA
ncbi:MAG TPA: saccharopine dehydrogenase NADP-binding domain-containing protein [Myxococcota bacterium]|nr:saccharopine dehydrogenase NADP-binding domain-containing protein [Myxococcota bacterium]